MRTGFSLFLWIPILALLASCSATKYVPEGAYLLEEVKIQTDRKEIKPSELAPYLRQNPNSKWFSLFKTQLYIYNASGRDSTRWINRTLRRMGDAPVIYSEEEALKTQEELTKAVHNMGYMSATVDGSIRTKRKKLKLLYQVHSGAPYIVHSIHYDVPDGKIAHYLRNDSAATRLREGMLFDVNVLDAERQRITQVLQNHGYYRFHKDYITYTADTIQNTYQVDLTLHLHLYRAHATDEPRAHDQFHIGEIRFVTDYEALQSTSLQFAQTYDSIRYKGYPIYFREKMYLRPRILTNNLMFSPGDLYSEQNIQRTYSNFGRLSALKYTNMRFMERQQGDSLTLDSYILLTRNRPQSVSFEVEGTNTSGDPGVAASVSYQNRNLFHGSETFLLKFRGAFEAISQISTNNTDNNYTEFGVESCINFPNFLFPFLSSAYKRKIRATTEFGLQYNYQIRPEFSRTVANGSWSYRWSERQRVQHRIDMLDISFVYLPWKSLSFTNDYLNGDNPILEYNYKNRLIVRNGYTYHYNSSGTSNLNRTATANSFAIRAGIESAGNLLYLISRATKGKINRSEGEEYKILNIPYAQYLKGDFDFAQNIVMDERNSLAFHAAFGIAVPYGNANAIPFEKRYFSGGANSVRGWSVRGLGPGSFPGDGNFLNQSGDIKLDVSAEYRTRLFWKFNGAAFIDAGNIWTLRKDEINQPGGFFRFREFYKQIAIAYGLGLRLDMDFLILRFDGGMKALNPVYSSGKDRYPIIHPNFSRDFTFHFAVGYPF
ncbi:MAG: outer membrane protein assembly factor [Bacteroides sp.]|nr:outer membrane protein assembly factor [Bacteroides sp.]